MGELTRTQLDLFEGLHRIHVEEPVVHKNLLQDFIVAQGQENVFQYDLLH